MSSQKFLKGVATFLVILAALWVLQLALGIGFGLIKLAFAILGGLVGLILSKEVITLAAIGTVIYLVANRKKSTCHDHYRYY